MSADPWQPPQWHHTVTTPDGGWPVPPARIRWDREARDAAGITLVLVLIAPVVGLIWSHVGPRLAVAPLLRGSAGGFRAEAGADFHFLVVGLVVGVVCGLAAVRLGRDGPGASLGLGVGGLLAGLVAARVGYLANRGGTLASLHHFGVKLSVLDHFHLDPFFKVRALGVLVAWPIAAVIVHSLIVGIRHRSA